MLIYVPVLITCQAGQRKRVAANVFGRASNRSSLHGQRRHKMPLSKAAQNGGRAGPSKSIKSGFAEQPTCLLVS